MEQSDESGTSTRDRRLKNRMSITMASETRKPLDSVLVRRVNQLFHSLTQDAFDTVHDCRFDVERPFWSMVASHVLKQGCRQGLSRVANRTARTQGRVVVDLACGTGFVTQILSGALTSEDRIIAMDLGEAPLHATARKWACLWGNKTDRPRFEHMATDAALLPLADRSVNLLAMNAALHHVPSPLAVLREIDRVLRPGGFFALGFEPNRRHFASAAMATLSGGLTRMTWYASWRQNIRRLRSWRARHLNHSEKSSAKRQPFGSPSEDIIATVLNERLLRDGLITEPLPESQLLDLVDPHARGQDVGLDPGALIREIMPDYRLHFLNSSDYLGETMRHWSTVRSLVDVALRTVAPRYGSLFSWLLSKPDDASEVAL